MTLGKSWELSGEVYSKNVEITQVGMAGLVPVDMLVVCYEGTYRSG